jgi:hypothetical protein
MLQVSCLGVFGRRGETFSLPKANVILPLSKSKTESLVAMHR